MRESLAIDKKLLAYLILILILLISIGLIWRHYDIELKAIEKQRSEISKNVQKINITYHDSPF